MVNSSQVLKPSIMISRENENGESFAPGIFEMGHLDVCFHSVSASSPCPFLLFPCQLPILTSKTVEYVTKATMSALNERESVMLDPDFLGRTRPNVID